MVCGIMFSFLECFSWLDLCQMRWRCHSQYYYKKKPHRICPVRPIAPPPIPGVCRYNVRVGHCHFDRPSGNSIGLM